MALLVVGAIVAPAIAEGSSWWDRADCIRGDGQHELKSPSGRWAVHRIEDNEIVRLMLLDSLSRKQHELAALTMFDYACVAFSPDETWLLLSTQEDWGISVCALGTAAPDCQEVSAAVTQTIYRILSPTWEIYHDYQRGLKWVSNERFLVLANPWATKREADRSDGHQPGTIWYIGLVFNARTKKIVAVVPESDLRNVYGVDEAFLLH
jgi:hypothetical protein